MRNHRFLDPVLFVALLLPAGEPALMAQEEPQVEAPAAEVPLTIPGAERDRRNPVARTPESVRHGEELFQTQCSMCHGIRGDGKGDLVQRLNLRPPDFTEPKPARARTDGELFYILTHGHGDMPGEGERLQDEWKWDLVNYIRTLARGE